MNKSPDKCADCQLYQLGIDRGFKPEPIFTPASQTWYWKFPRFQDDPNYGFSPICRIHQSEIIKGLETK